MGKEQDIADVRLMGAAEVADTLGVSKSTIYTLAREGKIRHVAIGKLIRFRPDDLERFIAENTHAVIKMR